MREQEMKLAKVKKSCKTAKVVARILSVITGIGAVAAAAGSAILFGYAGEINPALAEASKNGELLARGEFETNGILSMAVNVQNYFEAGQYAEGIATVCLVAVVLCILATVIFHLIAKTFVSLEKSESPFASEIIKSLKKVFIILTVCTGLLLSLGSAVMLGLVLWCIYCIMDYGCVLQEEVDDTI